jgi:hypothetical protein
MFVCPAVATTNAVEKLDVKLFVHLIGFFYIKP